MKVLIVEDDKYLLDAYRLKFGKAGHEVKEAFDGREVLSILEWWKPDVIVLDLLLPGIDGFECLKRIRTDGRWRDIPVLAASNLGEKADKDKALGYGANEYVVKSNLSLDNLLKRTENLVTKQR